MTARALRFYEDEGLLSPERKGNSRIYGRRDKARLAWILRAKRVGFSLVEIRELIDLYYLADGRVTQRRATMQKYHDQIGKLERQREDIDRSLDELRSFLTELDLTEAQGHLAINGSAINGGPCFDRSES